MELGGNAPFIVFADADLDAAIEGALVAKLRHNGEACTAANRFYVEQPVVEDFTRRLSAAMGALKMGNGLDPDVRVGPLVDEATRAKVVRLVDAAVGAGARVQLGGRLPSGPGFFYPATVLDCVAPDSPILAEEIFGPVAPIVAFSDSDEMIRHANATEYGLVAYVYTRDLARGLRVVRSARIGHGRPQPRPGLRSRRALRRRQTERHRPRGRPPRPPRVHRDQIHRRHLVGTGRGRPQARAEFVKKSSPANAIAAVRSRGPRGRAPLTLATMRLAVATSTIRAPPIRPAGTSPATTGALL